MEGSCLNIVTCIKTDAPPPPNEIPINQQALESCLSTCLDEPCWDASCSNDGQCIKIASCISASTETDHLFTRIPNFFHCLKDCDDGNSCTKDTCFSNQCFHKNICIYSPHPNKCTDNSGCDDGKYCNGKELCQNGACVASPPVTCPALGDLCQENLCDEGIKGCIATPKPDCSVPPESPPDNPPNSSTDNPPSGSAGKKDSPPPSSSPSSDACASVPLDDGNPCTEDFCDSASKTVTHKLIPDCAIIRLGKRRASPLFNVESYNAQGGASCSLRKEVPTL